jgi:hypothetical protein
VNCAWTRKDPNALSSRVIRERRMLTLILLMLLISAVPCAIVIAIYEIATRRRLSRLQH